MLLHHTSTFLMYHAEDIGEEKDGREMHPNWANQVTLDLNLMLLARADALTRKLWQNCPLPGQQRMALFAMGALSAEASRMCQAFQVQEVLQLAYTLGCARGSTKALLKRMAGKGKALDEAEKLLPKEGPLATHADQALRMARQVVKLADLLQLEDPNEVLGDKKAEAYGAVCQNFVDTLAAWQLYQDRLDRRELILQLDGSVGWNRGYSVEKTRTPFNTQSFLPKATQELRSFLLALAMRAHGQPIQMDKVA